MTAFVGKKKAIGSFGWYRDGSNSPIAHNDLYVADLNGDGFEEVVFAGFETQPNSPAKFSNASIAIFGWKEGVFQNLTQTLVPANLSHVEGTGDVTFGDFNGDGNVDFLTTGYSDMEHPVNTYVFWNKGTFFERESLGPSLWVHGATSKDINQDGFDDVVLSIYDRNSYLFMGSDSGLQKFTFEREWDSAGSGVAIGDFLGDGTFQAVFVDRGTGTSSDTGLFRLELNSLNKTASATLISVLPTPLLEGKLNGTIGSHDVRVRTFDFSNDGLDDIIVFSRAASNDPNAANRWPEISAVQFLLNRGQGDFRDVTNDLLVGYKEETGAAYSPRILDLNDDGLLDIFISQATWGSAHDSTSALLQTTEGQFVDTGRREMSALVSAGGGVGNVVRGPGEALYFVSQEFVSSSSGLKSNVFLTPLSIVYVNQTPTGSVSITGAAKQGQKLTVSHTLKDADGIGVVTYQWKADGASISGATGSSLTLTQSHVGKSISVTASYVDGRNNTESKDSVSTASVVNVNDLPVGSVSIAGSPTQYQTLIASNNLTDLDGLGEVTYTWMSGKMILGTGSTYTLSQGDVGKNITVRANYVDGFNKAESKVSSATSKVVNVNDAPVVVNPIFDQAASEGVAFRFSLPGNTFADLDKDKLTYTADSLPAWLKFSKGVFSGTPIHTASETTYSIVVTASDVKGATASDTFTLTVVNVPTISGTKKADVITANAGNDVINGLAGNDTINGGDGDDTIDGGLGNDILTGGSGMDFFKFTTSLKGNIDRITDFTPGTDKLELDSRIFTKLLAGSLNESSFASTSETAGAFDYLVAKTVQLNGVESTALFYDGDGNGRGAAIQFATLIGVSNIAYTDFWII